MNANTGIAVGVGAAKIAVRVVGASVVAADAATIILATGGAVAIGLIAFGLFKLISSDS